jgi:hypothetical protein
MVPEAKDSSLCSQELVTAPYPESDEFTPVPFQPVFLRSVLNSSSCLCLGLPSDLFPSGFSTKTFYTFLSPLIHATCLAHFIFLDLICLLISVVLDRSNLSVPGCGGLISLQVGGNHSGEVHTLTSPGYPEGYADMLNCEWIFETAPGNHLGISFQNMDIEQSESCFLDYVQVYTGKKHA